MAMMVVALLLAAAPLVRPLTVEQPPAPGSPVTEAAVRRLARQAETAARGDRTQVVLGLDERFRQRWGDFESFPLSLIRTEGLTITLTAPFMAFRRGVAEYLRLREPIADVPWTNEAVVAVSVERLDAPDIGRVVVERDGREVAPVRSRLRPMTFTNGRGESAVRHAGDLHYAMSAFAPGATVTITAVPALGQSMVTTIGRDQLAVLR